MTTYNMGTGVVKKLPGNVLKLENIKRQCCDSLKKALENFVLYSKVNVSPFA